MALTTGDQRMHRTNNERTTERARERERDRDKKIEDLHQPADNRNLYAMPMNPWLTILGQVW